MIMWFVYDHIYSSLSQLIVILGFVYNILYNTEDDESAYSFDGIDTVYTTDDDQSIESYDSDVGDDDSVTDNPLGGFHGCGRTKLKLFAQSFHQIETMSRKAPLLGGGGRAGEGWIKEGILSQY